MILKNKDFFLDLAIHLEKSDMRVALTMLNLALDEAPEAPFLLHKKKVYESVLKAENKALKKENCKIVLLLVPAFVFGALTSHRYVYLTWLDFIASVFDGYKIEFIVTNEGGKVSQPKYTKDYINDKLKRDVSINFIPRYLVDEESIINYFLKTLGFCPEYCFYFEETKNNNSIFSKALSMFSKLVVIQANPNLEINKYANYIISGKNEKKQDDKFCYFDLPVNVEYVDDIKSDSLFIKSERKSVVSAYSLQRIYKVLVNNDDFKEMLFNFLDKHTYVDWYFIGESKENIEKLMGLDERFNRENLIFINEEPNLKGFFNFCDVYAYLPNTWGGTVTSRLAINSGMAFFAIKDDRGYNTKFTTEKYISDNFDDYFYFLSKAVSDNYFALSVNGYQKEKNSFHKLIDEKVSEFKELLFR